MTTHTSNDIGQVLRNAARTPEQHERRISALDDLVGLLVIRHMLQTESINVPTETLSDLAIELNQLLDHIGEVSQAEFAHLLYGDEVH
jgi:hypothetical protein